MHVSIFVGICGNTYVSYLSMYYPCYPGLGRTLEYFYVMLSLHEYLLYTIWDYGSPC
jgi:hypothetical protein